MTFVEGALARSVGPDSFRDITPCEVVSFVGGVTFDGDLTLEQAAAVRDRMTSTDDVDLCERAKIRAAVDQGAVNLAAMVAAKVLGDPVPDAVMPDPVDPVDPSLPPPS